MDRLQFSAPSSENVIDRFPFGRPLGKTSSYFSSDHFGISKKELPGFSQSAKLSVRK